MPKNLPTIDEAVAQQFLSEIEGKTEDREEYGYYRSELFSPDNNPDLRLREIVFGFVESAVEHVRIKLLEEGIDGSIIFHGLDYVRNEVYTACGRLHALLQRQYENEGGQFPQMQVSKEYVFDYFYSQDHIRDHAWRSALSDLKLYDKHCYDVIELGTENAEKRVKQGMYENYFNFYLKAFADGKDDSCASRFSGDVDKVVEMLKEEVFIASGLFYDVVNRQIADHYQWNIYPFGYVLALCEDLARDVGKIMNQNFGRVIARKKHSNPVKGTDDDVFNTVTDVDLELQRKVARELLHHFPEFEFHGEEDIDAVFDPEEDAELIERIRTNKSPYQFVVDPLDGTSRYARRDARYSFLLGLFHEDQFHIALGYNPKTDTMITALYGSWCMVNGKVFHFDSSINDHVAINSKIKKHHPGLKQELDAQGISTVAPNHTGTMYEQLFKQQICAMISFNTNTHDHPLSLAVEQAGGKTLVYHNGLFIPGRFFDWRSPEAKKDANIPAYIAAKDEKTAWNMAEIAVKYLKAGIEK